MNLSSKAKRGLLLSAIIASCSNLAFADIRESIDVLKNHPQVLGEKAKGLASDARVAQQSAQWLPNISLSTDGGRRIFGSAGASQSRSLRDNEYIDVVVTGRQLLYDFGAVDGYIEEAEFRSQADAFLDDIALNRLVGELMQFTQQYQVEQERAQIVVGLIEPLKEQADLSKQRYEAGVSNGDDYRRLQMDIDRLHRDKVEVDRRLKDIAQKLAEQFALGTDAAIELAEALVDLPILDLGSDRLSDQSRRLRELAARSRVSAAEAERKPRFELELELRGFDVADNLISENELTGNLQVTMPFFDGGALRAKAEVAAFERAVVQQEQAFELRVLRERTAQIQEELASLASVRLSLDEQRATAAEALQMALNRQGQTAVEISQVNTGLMAIYQIDSELLDARLRASQLDVELITLNERWPAKVDQVVLALEK